MTSPDPGGPGTMLDSGTEMSIPLDAQPREKPDAGNVHLAETVNRAETDRLNRAVHTVPSRATGGDTPADLTTAVT